MALRVGVVSQKGGVGKSTIARLIAREYATHGWDVKIADLDVSQGTSVDWKLRREQRGHTPDIGVETFNTVALALKRAGAYDLMIFDGPPHSTSGTLDIARHCDLVILPTGLARDDLKPSVMLAHELVDHGIDTAKITFVLCRVGDRPNEIQEARAYIRKAGYVTLQGELPEKTGYRRASDEGRAPTETLYPTLKEKAEFLAQQIIDALTRQQRRADIEKVA
jgi:chromosome partitioning protein